MIAVKRDVLLDILSEDEYERFLQDVGEDNVLLTYDPYGDEICVEAKRTTDNTIIGAYSMKRVDLEE